MLQPFIRNTGPALSPFNAWVLLKGLETLALRVDAGCRAAAAIADFLAEPAGGAPRLVSDARRSSAARAGHGADERRRHGGDVRGRRRQGRRVPR